MSEKDVATVDANFDKHDIPYDCIWLDIEHTDGKAYFSWNSASFPTPEKMLAGISGKKRKMVNVVDPHIKKDEKFHVYTELRSLGLYTKKIDWKQIDDPTDSVPADWVHEEKILDADATSPPEWNVEEDGDWEQPKIDNPAYKGKWSPRQIYDPSSPMSDYEGWCWPGTSSYPDFTNPEMRAYWGSQFALDKYKGTGQDTYVWNDMNEPSVFNGPEVTMPRDVIHPHGNVEHRDVHNMYGYYVHRATFEGLQRRNPRIRPFVLTRSFFIGSHKYAAIWTGDNTAHWGHLQASVSMVGALALCGQSLVGADVGGFFKHPDTELMIRWYQLAVLAYPFLRNHAHLETPRREPYVFEERTMNLIKSSIQLRYRMLPLWYTLFEEYHRLGLPVVRPVWYNFLEDSTTHTDENAVENEIMLGDVLLVRCITAPLKEPNKVAIYLPSGSGWYDLHTGRFYAPGSHQVSVTLENIPAFYRAGTIVPLKYRVRRSSSCMALDPLTLNIYLNERGEAKGRVYLDDFTTTSYQTGEKLEVEFDYFKNGTLTSSAVLGTLPAGVAAAIERVEVFGGTLSPVRATLTYANEKKELPTPVLRGGGFVIKVKPWVDLKQNAWQIDLL